MKRLLILLTLMISASMAQAQSTIIDDMIKPEQSEQSAKRTLRSLGFIMQASDIEDNIKKLTYSSNSEECKYLQVFLCIKNATVFKVEWGIKPENDYSTALNKNTGKKIAYCNECLLQRQKADSFVYSGDEEEERNQAIDRPKAKPEIFSHADEPPQFPGGEKGLMKWHGLRND